MVGFAYIIVQFIGCFAGALIAYMFTQHGGLVTIVGRRGDNYIFQAILSETFGSFLYIFVFLTQTEKMTRFSNDSGIWALIVSSCYGSVLYYNSNKVSPSMNPAYALAVHMTMLMDSDTGSNYIKYLWIFMIFPFIGGILALLFYEFVYKRTQEYVEEDYQNRTSRKHGLIPPSDQ